MSTRTRLLFSPLFFVSQALHFAGVRLHKIHRAMVKKTNLALAIVLLAATFVGCGGQPSSATTPRSGIVFVGDSIFGRLVDDPTFLATGSVDDGRFGWRTDQLLAAFPDILNGKVCTGYQPPDGLPADPEFPYICTNVQPPAEVVLMAGWNNFFGGNVGNTAAADIAKMVEMARAARVRIIVCTLFKFDPAHPADWMVPKGNAPTDFYDIWRNPLNSEIRKMGVEVIDLDAAFENESDFTIDGVHPNHIGNEIMLREIAAVTGSTRK